VLLKSNLGLLVSSRFRQAEFFIWIFEQVKKAFLLFSIPALATFLAHPSL
jgi:hypothetical protein